VSAIGERLAPMAGRGVKAAPDPALLAELLEHCRLYDIDGLDSAMSELTSYEYETDQELVDWLAASAKVMGFKQIARRLSEIL
jgi:hypothetical protein